MANKENHLSILMNMWFERQKMVNQRKKVDWIIKTWNSNVKQGGISPTMMTTLQDTMYIYIYTYISIYLSIFLSILYIYIYIYMYIRTYMYKLTSNMGSKDPKKENSTSNMGIQPLFVWGLEDPNGELTIKTGNLIIKNGQRIGI